MQDRQQRPAVGGQRGDQGDPGVGIVVVTVAWTPAITTGNEPRDGADVAELAGVLGPKHLAGWPAGLRLIVRREHPHPGAQLHASRNATSLPQTPSPFGRVPAAV